MSQSAGIDAASRGVGMSGESKAIMIAVIVTVIGALIYLYVLPSAVNGSRLSTAASEAKVHDLKTGYVFADKVDWYGNEIHLTREINPGKTAVTYTAISAGKDGVFGNGDDETKSAVDHNLSKMAGIVIGQVGKQAYGGIKEGLKAKSKFD